MWPVPDTATGTIGLGPLRPAPPGLPDPSIRPPIDGRVRRPVHGRSASSTCWPASSAPDRSSSATSPTGSTPTHLDWLFPRAVVADVVVQLQANWMTDYRNTLAASWSRTARMARRSPSRTAPGSIRGSCARPSARPRRCRERLAEFSRRDRVGRRMSRDPARPGPLTVPGGPVHDRTAARLTCRSAATPPTRRILHEPSRLRQRRRPRRRRLGPGTPRRSERPLRRGRRRHDRLRAEPPARRGRLGLDEPAVRRRSAATSRRARTSRRCCRESGIGPDTTIVLYGDNNNWFAAWAYWQLKLYGHRDVRILNGGRKYWLDNGLPLTTDVPSYAPPAIELPEPDFTLRAFRDDILPRLGDAALALVDVRTPAEFNGEIIAPPGMSETAQRAGHIPGAASIPWAQTVREDGTFKSRRGARDALRGQGRHGRQGHHRLLPDRRAIQPLVVRPARAARLPARPQLRRQLDRVGQHGRRADREVGPVPSVHGGPPAAVRGRSGRAPTPRPAPGLRSRHGRAPSPSRSRSCGSAWAVTPSRPVIVVGGDERVDDRLLGRLDGGLEQRVDGVGRRPSGRRRVARSVARPRAPADRGCRSRRPGRGRRELFPPVPPARASPSPARWASRSHWWGRSGASVATMHDDRARPRRRHGRVAGPPPRRRRSRRPWSYGEGRPTSGSPRRPAPRRRGASSRWP